MQTRSITTIGGSRFTLGVREPSEKDLFGFDVPYVLVCGTMIFPMTRSDLQALVNDCVAALNALR